MALIIDRRPRFLALHSCQAAQIDNERIFELSPSEIRGFRDFDRDYGSDVERRGSPTPIYNCHGLTFASRRTGIFESETLRQILREDDYMEIPPERALEGDVILYFDDSGDFEHSGIVILRPLADNLNVPRVCSKWGKYAEVIHWGNRCPYNFANVKYYRLRA